MCIFDSLSKQKIPDPLHFWKAAKQDIELRFVASSLWNSFEALLLHTPDTSRLP